MNGRFDNIVWHTLNGPHAKYTVGNDVARCYGKGFPPIAAFRNLHQPDFHALEPFVEHGGQLSCDGWTGVAPDGWEVMSESTLVRMTWAGASLPEDALPDAVLLRRCHAPAALELAALTHPGPFTLRSLELGEYFGILDGALLVAMAGSRICADGFSEICSVCTHPGFTGRGFARRLVIKILNRQLLRGESPFLRVMKDSAHACCLYRNLGFHAVSESLARTVVRR